MLALLGVLAVLAGVVGVVGGLVVLACALSRCPNCRAYHTSEAEQEACDREHGGGL